MLSYWLQTLFFSPLFLILNKEIVTWVIYCISVKNSIFEVIQVIKYINCGTDSIISLLRLFGAFSVSMATLNSLIGGSCFRIMDSVVLHSKPNCNRRNWTGVPNNPLGECIYISFVLCVHPLFVLFFCLSHTLHFFSVCHSFVHPN